MTPDKKYMHEVNLESEEDIKFVPLSDINKRFCDHVTNNVSNDLNLDLFPSETGLPKLCYYSEEQEAFLNENSNINIPKEILPTTFDVLRGIDLDLDETKDLERVYSDNDVNKIYFQMEQRNPGIFATLYSYRIPRPIVRVIVKRLIRLSLLYCDRN